MAYQNLDLDINVGEVVGIIALMEQEKAPYLKY